MELFGFCIHRAATIRKLLKKATARLGKGVSESDYWYMVGVHESRIVGICIYRTSESRDHLIKFLKESL